MGKWNRSMSDKAPRALSEDCKQALSTLVEDQISRGWHSGAQLSVYRDGLLSLDVRCGTASPVGSRLLWFSVTKSVTAVAVLKLVERGMLDLDRPISFYWPEFGQGGKQQVTARHVLLHQGGFPVFSRDFDWDRIGHWDEVCAATASLEAIWEPGTDVGYHPVTYGFVLGELIRLVDGRQPREFLWEEIFEPLRMEASLGLPGQQYWRFVPIEARSEATWQDLEGTEKRTSELVARFSRRATLGAELPAANAIGTSEALARFFAMLEQGGSLDGVTILMPQTVAEATRILSSSLCDRVTGMPSSFGLGFLVGGPFEPFCDPGVFGHTGQQCVVAWADPIRGLAVAFITTGLQDPLTTQLRTEEVVRVLKQQCAIVMLLAGSVSREMIVTEMKTLDAHERCKMITQERSPYLNNGNVWDLIVPGRSSTIGSLVTDESTQPLPVLAPPGSLPMTGGGRGLCGACTDVRIRAARSRSTHDSSFFTT